MHTIAAKAVAFNEALRPDFTPYQQQVVVNARAMGDELTARRARLVAGGTDTHLLAGRSAVRRISPAKPSRQYLDEIRITVNKNAIPFDPQKPMVTSGIRIGSPAITSRGFKAEECREVGRIIGEVLNDIEPRDEVDALRDRVHELTARYDVP